MTTKFSTPAGGAHSGLRGSRRRVGTARDVSRAALLAASAIAAGALALPAVAADPAPLLLAQAQSDSRQITEDLGITTKVKDAIALDSELKTQVILIDTMNGIVRITGQVDSAAKVDRAKELARRIDGVKAVDSQLTVREIRPS